MNYLTKIFLFHLFLAILGMIALIILAGFKVKNLTLVFTLMVGIFALFDSNYLRKNRDSFREWMRKKVGNEKIESMTKAYDKFINVEKYLSISMFVVSIILIIYHPIKTGGFSRPNNIVGLITIIIGIGLLLSSGKLLKDYFPEIFKTLWFINSFKFACIILVIIGITMILLFEF